MGQLDPNNAIGILHGSIGDLVFVRTEDGRIFVRHRPVRKAAFKPGELANQSRFALAAAYVKQARSQPELYAAYQLAALKTKKRSCNLAHADFWHPPIIHTVDVTKYTGQAGEMIRLEATDDFAVAAVTVAITALDGLLLEKGTAEQVGTGAEWAYTAQSLIAGRQTVIIHASASDRPGNTVTRSYEHALV